MSDLSQVLALKKHLTEIGALLGVPADLYETPDGYARRVKERVLNLKAAAGITWSGYTCTSPHGALFIPQEGGLEGGPVFAVKFGGSLEDLATQIGEWESLTS